MGEHGDSVTATSGNMLFAFARGRAHEKAFTPPNADAPDMFALEAKAKEIPLGRWGEPDDIGQMTVYLASPAGNWITGSIFVVDGGSWLAGRT